LNLFFRLTAEVELLSDRKINIFIDALLNMDFDDLESIDDLREIEKRLTSNFRDLTEKEDEFFLTGKSIFKKPNYPKVISLTKWVLLL
jgi:hypothetical protein